MNPPRSSPTKKVHDHAAGSIWPINSYVVLCNYLLLHQISKSDRSFGTADRVETNERRRKFANVEKKMSGAVNGDYSQAGKNIKIWIRIADIYPDVRVKYAK